jgi:hypothetical protein
MSKREKKDFSRSKTDCDLHCGINLLRQRKMDSFKPQIRKKYEKIPFEKGTPEYRAEQLRRQRECRAANKEKYKREYDVEKNNGAPPVPKDNELTWPVPVDLQDYIGMQNITVPSHAYDWPLFRIKRHSQLAAMTLKGYQSYWVRLPKKHIWDICRELRAMQNGQQNMFFKAGLSFTCENLYNSIYVRKIKNLLASAAYKNQLLEMMVYHTMTRKTMRASYDQHMAQVASVTRHENTVDWDVWVAGARRFVRAMLSKEGATRAELMEALAVAVYSYIPPIRLDWNDVIIRMCNGSKAAFNGVKGEAGKNILYLSPTWAVVFWGEFKNVAAFGDEVPLRQELPSELHRILRKVYPEDKLQANDYEWTPFKKSNFGTYLAALAKIITGKNFTNRLMRSSYIGWYHKNHRHEEFDIEKTRLIMRQLHQTGLAVHLAYNKFKTGEESPDEDEMLNTIVSDSD